MAQVVGEKVRKFMKKKIQYSDEPMENIEIIKDFLPSPDQLAFKEDAIKVTLSLSPKSVAFFKAHAKSNKAPYQKMIRRLIDSYVEKHS